MDTREILLWSGLVIGVLFGLNGQWSGFCLNRALKEGWDSGAKQKAQSFALALVVAILGAIDYYAAGFVALEQDAFHWFAAADARAHFCGRISHRLRQRVAAADGVPDAVLVFDEWQN